MTHSYASVSKDEDGNFCCDQCDKKYTSKTCLYMHRNIHTDKYKCNNCERTHQTSSLLKLHQEKCSKDVKPTAIEPSDNSSVEEKVTDNSASHDETFYPCDLCEKVYDSIQTLAFHRNIHTVNYNCDNCGQSHQNQAELNFHKSRPDACERYVKLRLQKVDSNIYKMSNERDNISSSSETISDSYSTSAEEETELSDTKSKNQQEVSIPLLQDEAGNFQCDQCDAKYLIKASLLSHKNVHTDRFKCTKCEQGFMSNRSKDRHNCETTLRLRQNPKIHFEASQDEEGNYLCDQCDNKLK